MKLSELSQSVKYINDGYVMTKPDVDTDMMLRPDNIRISNKITIKDIKYLFIFYLFYYVLFQRLQPLQPQKIALFHLLA